MSPFPEGPASGRGDPSEPPLLGLIQKLLEEGGYFFVGLFMLLMGRSDSVTVTTASGPETCCGSCQ